jgi:predicted DNA-binding ribbon-helix-helix protein
MVPTLTFISPDYWKNAPTEYYSPSPYLNRQHEGEPVKSAVIKRSVIIGSHRTSISLEDAFWRHLNEIARAEGWTVSKLIAEIDGSGRYGNLSSAIRLFVLEHFRAKSNFTQPDSRQTEAQMGD